MDHQPIIPPEHAHLIRGCGVGFGAQLFLPSHIGARPVVTVRSTGEPACSCCGERIPAGQAALQADYYVDPRQHEAIYLHAAHCEWGVSHAPLPARVSA